MRRYKATLTNGEEFFVLATEHHEAAQEAADYAREEDQVLKDVALIPDRGYDFYE
jgi:hypothetical protein